MVTRTRIAKHASAKRRRLPLHGPWSNHFSTFAVPSTLGHAKESPHATVFGK
jgi:hypothetical protein